MAAVLCGAWLALGLTTEPAQATLAERSSVAAAERLIDAFDAVCAEQVEQNRIADKTDLVTLSPEQISSLSTALGYRKQPDAIWAAQDAAWYQVQSSLEAPASCQFVSFEITLEDIQTAWSERYVEAAGWQSFAEPTLEPSGGAEAGPMILSGAYAFRRFEGQVILSAVAGMQMKDTGLVMLRYHKTKASSQSCANEGECD
jgi:hypothetical protein